MRVSKPPGPVDRFFGMGLLRRMQPDLLGFFADLQQRYGDVVYMRLGPYRDYTLFHPQEIHEVLVKKSKSFYRMWRIMEVMRKWNGEGVLIQEGAEWQRQRRIVQPAFQPKRLEKYALAVVAAAEDTCAKLGAAADGVDFERAMNELSTAVICRTMFGTDLGDALPTVRRAVQTASRITMREISSPVTWPDWLPLPEKRAKREALRTLRETVNRFIVERRADNRDQGDLLSMLLLAVDEEGDGRGLTDEQARDNLMTIFLAGHDTTAAAFTWVGWMLATHPQQAARAAEEVDAALGGRAPGWEDLPKLGAVEQFVKETLRLYPPVVGVFNRQAVEDVEIGGWQIPRGSLVRILSFVTQRDPRWFRDPERFDPERFAGPEGERIPPGAYFPFGMGPRACLGQHFAMLELVLVTAMLVRRFKFSPAEGQKEPKLELGLSLRPAGGLRLTLRSRGMDGR